MEKQSHGHIRPHSSKINALSRLLDVLIITFTLWAVVDLLEVGWSNHFTFWLLLAVVSFEFFAELTDIYRKFRGVYFLIEWGQILLAWLCVYLVFVVAQQIEPIDDNTNQHVFWIWMLLVPLELISWQIIIRYMIGTIRKRGKNSRRAAIVGATSLGQRLKKVILEETWMGVDFIGFYDDRLAIDKNEPRVSMSLQDIAGSIDNLIEKSKQGHIDIIYITLALAAEKRIKEIIEKLSDTTVSVYYVPDLFVFDLLRSRWINLQGIPAVSIYDSPFYGVDGWAKRFFDFVLAGIILVIIFIPMVIIALGVKFTSSGPILFKQHRYGFGGQEIEIWKFRSMSVCQDGKDVPQATRNDARITPFGAFLRKTSLDELPQFFNVLQGRMSIVGPRPHAVSHNEFYRKHVRGYMLRHKVRPGITGLAQVKGYRGETDTLDKMENRIKFDLTYISNWSLLLDIQIIMKTVLIGFTGPDTY